MIHTVTPTEETSSSSRVTLEKGPVKHLPRCLGIQSNEIYIVQQPQLLGGHLGACRADLGDVIDRTYSGSGLKAQTSISLDDADEMTSHYVEVQTRM